jgi:predicted transcriptional regulator
MKAKGNKKRSFFKYRLSIILGNLQITNDRKKRVIDLHFNQHKTYAEIAQIEKMSPRDIHAIIKEEIARRQKHKDQELSTEANKLFSEGKTTVQVATMLNLPVPKVSKLYIEYWKLRGLDVLNTIYKETNGKIWPFLKLYKELIKKRGMSKEQVAKVVEIAIDKLPHMESLYEQVKEQVEKMQRTRQRLENYSHFLNDEIASAKALLNSYHLLCERKRKEAENLNNELSRLEALVSHFKIKDEGYSNLKQIVKENVKVVLSEKRVLISISFAAVIQTLKADPQMIKLIQNITGANDGKQYKDNNNNITTYLEFNKDRIMDLAEKHYENLVEALTNNAIDSTTAASSNPTLSLPQSSLSTFPNLSNKNNIYKIEESEIYDNSKSDIAD